MEFEIQLENLKFFAHHGVFEHEQRDGNEFEVNLSVKYNLFEPIADELKDTVSYATLFEIVDREMKIPRKLLETVASNIATEVKERFPFCFSIVCKITKLYPPIPQFMGKGASVICKI